MIPRPSSSFRRSISSAAPDRSAGLARGASRSAHVELKPLGAGGSIARDVIRLPAVAGHFYPADPEELRLLVRSFLFPSPREEAIAVLGPHAGYLYSGSGAGKAYSS